MYILEKLWRGEITPSEVYVTKGTEYHSTLVRFCNECEALSATLDAEGKERLEQIFSLQNDLKSMSEQEIFLESFRMGALLMLDLLQERQRTFHMAGERSS